MKIITKNSILGTTLVALAILNFSVLDQIGVGLVTSVNDKFEELGADWIALQTTSQENDVEAVASSLASVKGVHQVATSLSWNQVTFTSEEGPQGVEWLVPGPDYDLQAMPFLFVFQEDEESGAAFYRDLIQWIDGQAPGDSGFAVSTDYADENSLQVGNVVQQTFGGNPFTGDGGLTLNLTLHGIYERAYSDDSGNAFDIVILGPNEELEDHLGSMSGLRSSVMVRGDLDRILSTSDAVVDQAEAMGYSVTTENFQIGGRTFGGRQGGGAPPGGFGGGQGGGGPGGGPPGGFTGGIAQNTDFTLYANGGVLSEALDAAARAGTWFRMLTTSAVLMALIGIAFVTAAMEKKVRRDVGIRQAVGYPLKRIWIHWATVSTAMGLVGGVIGVGLVYALASIGAAGPLLGIDVTFRNSLGAIFAPIASVLVFGIATLPTYAKVLRSAPADNLRVLSE